MTDIFDTDLLAVDEAASLVSLFVAEHPKTEDCPIDECSVCAYRDCPGHEVLHYHHDGCPYCTTEDQP